LGYIRISNQKRGKGRGDAETSKPRIVQGKELRGGEDLSSGASIGNFVQEKKRNYVLLDQKRKGSMALRGKSH